MSCIQERGSRHIKLVAMLVCFPLVAFNLSKQIGQTFCSTQLPSSVSSLSRVDGTSGRLFDMQHIRSYVPESSDGYDSGVLALPVDENGQAFPICEIWAVITSINPPTKTVSQLAAMSDVCVCVVADAKSPATYGLENVVYLTPSIQV
jgi:hypothetical protein